MKRYKLKKPWKLVTVLFVLFLFALSFCIYKSMNRATVNSSKTNSEEVTNPQNLGNQVINPEKNYENKPLINNDKSVPVLMYHSIGFEKGNELRVPVERFTEQMKFLKDNGYTTLSLDELYDFFNNNKPIPSKSVVITFDDGYADNYTNAYPVLKELGLKATMFVITSTIDKNSGYLNSSQLKEMQNNKISIESHTVNHVELDKIPYAKQLDTLKKSKDMIENILDNKVYYICYPVGKWNNDTLKAAKQAGYKMGFTTKNSLSNKANGLYTLNRVRINASYGITTFKKVIGN